VLSSGNSYIQVQRVDGTATAYNLLLQPNGGNVGIGVGTTPLSEKLEVNGNIKATSFIKSGGTPNQFLMADGSVKNTTTYINSIGGNRVLPNWYIKSPYEGGMFSFIGDDYPALSWGQSTAHMSDEGLFYLDSAGINQTSSGYSNYFSGEVNIGGSFTLDNTFLFRSNALKTVSATVGTFGTKTGGANDFQLIFNRTAAGTGSYYEIQSVEQGIGYRDIVLQKDGGNVGIGTTSPTTKLEVNGSIKVSETILGGSSSPPGTSYSGYGLGGGIGSYGGFYFYSKSDVDSDGFGTVNLGANPEDGVYFSVYNLDNSKGSYLTLTPYDFTLASGGDIFFSTKPSTTYQTRLVVKNTGEVGIGTIFPTNKLTILGTDDTIPALGSSGGKLGIFNGVSGTPKYGLLQGVLSNGNSYLQVQRIDGTATAYNLLLQPNGGNVGIGTSTPNAKLEVNGSILASSFVKSGGTPSQFLKADGSIDSNTYATQSWVSTNYPNQTLTLGTETEHGQSISLSNGGAGTITNYFVSSRDGSRLLTDAAVYPNANARRVRFDFMNAGQGTGGSGYYMGVMTYSPWDGTTTSTGDSSYQLAFLNETGINGTGLPGLALRKGIDTTWGNFVNLLHTGNTTISYSGNTLQLLRNGNVISSTTINAGNTYTNGSNITIASNQISVVDSPVFSGNVTAIAFYEGSLRKLKDNIQPFNKSGLELVNELEIVTFDRIDGPKNKIGIIADDSPIEFLSDNKDAVDLYKTIFVQAKAIQELSDKNLDLENTVNCLEDQIQNLRELITLKLTK
jgi:hypothetical protein